MRVDRTESYLDLFSRPTSGPPNALPEQLPNDAAEPAKIVPLHPGQTRALVKLEARGDLPVPIRESGLPAKIDGEEASDTETETDSSPLGDLRRAFDVRNMTPRQMTDLSTDLYANGVLDWEEYSMLAYQPELQPGYDRTIGALTGEPAEPNRPRDFVGLWEERLAFEERHNPADRPVIQRSRHILSVLQTIDRPTNMLV